ncbi:MAG TPA: TSUP family transporter, partial [Thermodesulfobacteriota bacterium]|nr:TSUP family transporter [Thermodesulfobacteriota bacterium]
LYGLRPAIAVVLVPTLLSDAWFVLRGLREGRGVAPVVPFVVAGLAGIVLGTRLLAAVDERRLGLLLAAGVFAFVAAGWRGGPPALPRAGRGVVGASAGFGAGLLQGSSGLSGPLVAMYLLGLGLPRERFLFALNAVFAALDATQIGALVRASVYTPALVRLAAAACLPAACGMALGLRVGRRLDERRFRRAVLLLLAATAASLTARGLAGR